MERVFNFSAGPSMLPLKFWNRRKKNLSVTALRHVRNGDEPSI